jgi:NAD(P)-dependent dehydrogenase (short-subunit alcohol dehydrogenase family)
VHKNEIIFTGTIKSLNLAMVPGYDLLSSCEQPNNAGIFIPKPFTDFTEEDYNLVMNTNVASFFYMTQQVIPQMKKQNFGSCGKHLGGFRESTERHRAARTFGRAVEIADAACE